MAAPRPSLLRRRRLLLFLPAACPAPSAAASSSAAAAAAAASPSPPPLLPLLLLLASGPGSAAAAARGEPGGGGGGSSSSRSRSSSPGGGGSSSSSSSSPCREKTVTVSTLPVLRESDIAWSGGGGGGGHPVGGGSSAAASPSLSSSSSSASSPSSAAAPGSVPPVDSRLLLFVRSELPGRVAVQDDLDNTELPFFTLEMSGTVSDISLVHWKQQWLENGTLYFHVSMSNAEQLSRATPPTLQEPSEIVEEQMHILHISVMGGLIALLLLLLVFTVALYAQRRWYKQRRIPQKSASTEATHEIHYIPSVLLGPQGRESFRNSRLQAHTSVIGMPIRETPILDDYDCEEEENPLRPEHACREDEFGSQMMRPLDSLGRSGEKPDYDKKAAEVTQETVESLMQKFKESFRTNTPIEIGHLQPALRSSSVGRRKRRNRSRGGIGFGRAKGNSGSEADDETQLTFYTEQYRSRRRSKGSLKSPVNKTALTLIAVSSCILAMVCGTQLSCPLTVKVTLHVPEHFIADGSSFVVSEGSYLDISDWLNPAKLSLYYQINATSPWVRDLCGQRTTDACEQLCDEETGECSCREGYAPDPVHRHLCVRNDWGHSEGPWPYTTLERGYDLVTGEQAPEKILSLGQGLWLPVSKSFVVPPVELSINPLASCKTDVLVTEDPADVREEAMLSTYFETINDLLSSFGPVRDCSRNNGGCTRNFKCVSDRKVDSTGCVCPEDLRPMKDGTGCYDYSKGIDCSDGFNGGCEQLCLQQTLPLPLDPLSSTIHMFCGCVEEYKLAPDGKSCLMLSDICEGPKCLKPDVKFNDTLFGEMLHGYNNRTQHVNQGQVFQMTFRENNFIKDFPQLADALMVIPLPVEEQCRGVLSEPLPNLQLLTGDIRYDEAMGYPMVQHWRVQSNLYRVKLSTVALSAGFSNVLKILNKASSREELLYFIQQYGSHYIAEALYGSELSCTIHFPSKKVQQQLWFQYQKETTEIGNKKELKSMPFITYLSGLLSAQMLSDDQLISGVEIHCEEKGRCPSTCHLCRRPGKEQLSPMPVLLEINRVVPLYTLIQDNETREAFKGVLMSSYWCSGKGDVIEDWCRCDLNAFDENGLPNCSPLPQPVLRLSPNVEPSSTVVSLEWLDVQPAIGTKVSDYILHHKKVDEYTDTDLYTGESLSFADDLVSGLGTACVAAGRSHGDVPDTTLYSVIFKCLEPDGLYKFTLCAVDTRGRHSELSTITMRTACPLVDDSKAEEIADKIYNLYNGYTSGKEQQTAYNTLMEVSASMLFRVQHHYNSHYEKFGDFVWRSEDELGPRKAHLILRRLEKVSSHCSTLLRSSYIQSRTDTMPYLFCRSEEVRPPGMVWYSILKDTKITCEEKMVSMLRNMYGESKGR
ncbi:astrotactin-2 isoform X1 [Rhineura floridana]|uniref:astrotactin-2 isoform X1 n=1 Tax=Rhineura floridana TaxID=261503 RepID=UPI002AC80A41|nr:astrotactin-2 isoform X1 [Rhineura floridana]